MLLHGLNRGFFVLRSPDGGEGGGGGGAGGGEPKLVPVEALQAERARAQAAAERAAAVEARLAKIEADAKAAEEARAAEAGEHRKLYESLKPEHEKATARLTELEARETKRLEKVAERNAARIKALPEAAAKMVKPVAGAMSPDDLADWLEEHGSTLGAPTGAFPLGTVAGKKLEEPIPPECTAEWEKYGKGLGLTVRDWYETNWKKRHPAKKE